MKAKAFHNKLLAIVLTVVLVAISIPTAVFMVGAAGEAPTVDATTDIGKYVNVAGSESQFKEYDSTGSVKVTSGNTAFAGASYAPNGTYYASVKMVFDPGYEYKFTANTATGKWEQNGYNYGQTGITIGTIPNAAGTGKETVTVSYRRGQGVFFLFNPSADRVANKLGNVTAGLNEVVLDVKYDASTKTLSVWFNGVKGNDIDMSTVDGFEFTGFGLRASGNGTAPADMNDISNTSTVANTVTFSDVHIWGNVSLSKHIAPEIGTNTNIAGTLTLSDATMNSDWKADGAFAWNFSNVAFNGIDFANNDIVYASVTMANIAKGNSGSDIYGAYFAKEGNLYAYSYLRPQWNQQGIAGTDHVSIISTDGMGVAGGNGSLSWNASQEEVFIFKYDKAAKTVDVWRRTGLHAGFTWDSIKSGEYQDVYVGKFSIGTDAEMAFGICVRPDTPASNFNKQPTVKDVKVWTEKSESGPDEEGPESIDFSFNNGALDTEYDQNGSVVLTSANGVVYLTGYNVVKGVGQKITYSFDMSYSAAPNSLITPSGKDNIAFVFAKKDSDYAGVGIRPTWQQTREKIGCTYVLNMLDNYLSTGDEFTGSYKGDYKGPIKYTAIYDVDNNTVEVYMDAQRVGGCYVNGNMLIATATLDQGYTFAPGISTENLVTGSMTVSNISIVSESVGLDESNMLNHATAYEGGFLDDGILYNDNAALGVTNTPVFDIGSSVNTTGKYVSLKATGYDGKKTVVWKGLVGDLSKGTITYEADFTIFNKTCGYSSNQSGFVVAKVNGHYVTSGLGAHSAAGSSGYNPITAIDGSNWADQAAGNKAFLGANAQSYAVTVTGTEAGTTAKIKVVLSATDLKLYVNDTLAQTFNLAGKTVEPVFAWAWGSGNINDYITNVKISGDGVDKYTCPHEYVSECDATCELCGYEREIDENAHSFTDNCDAECNNGCGTTRTPSHNFAGDCDTSCDDCGYSRIAPSAHTYDGASDINCNACGAERIALSALFKNGALVNVFKDQLAASSALYGTSFDMKPSQFATQTVSLGGAVFDLTKGYTISADFTVKTNSSMESHFGITALVINNEPYTFGMLSNGNWGAVNTPTQAYTPYVRKNNGNELIGATGTTVTATDAGATVNVKVIVTASAVTYYINNVEAKTIDITGKTVEPFAGFTSRGANVTVSNIEFFGAGVTNHTPHSFDSACDAICNDCFAVRVAADHVYDNDTCDADCNVCGGTRTVPHAYSFVCDDTCDICGTKRAVTHTFTDDCDEACDIDGCTATRTAPHKYEHDCDAECDCGATRFVNKHLYDDDADLECNRCGYTKPVFDFSGMEDHTDEIYLNNKDYREGIKTNGSFTMANGIVTNDGALIAKDSGKIVAQAKIKFNGNVDFNWLDNNGDGEYKYENAWGKVGIKLGTYFDVKYNRVMNLFVSFRRCSGAAHLFNDGNEVNYGNEPRYNFGNAGSKSAEEIQLTYLYDIDKGEVHLWADGKYINVTTVADLQDFKFELGYVTQGLGSTAVDSSDVTNGNTTPNTITVSELKLLGDLEKNPAFELPVTEHTHDYTDGNDLVCNTCGAEKIKFSTLIKTSGNLVVPFEDHLKASSPISGVSFKLNPGQYSTHSISLGGAKFDLSKGGYVLSADFTVDTNKSMESHFGITALVINNEPYTFGMLSNGSWNIGGISGNNQPTQDYIAYVRKNNGNELIGATNVVTVRPGDTVNLTVDVNKDRVIYYINGTESLKIGLAGKTVTPFAAFSSRGANVTISNINFDGQGVTNCTAHTYSGDCDSVCDICYGGVRTPGKTHTYDNETCDADCNICGTVREVAHVRDHDCDTNCKNCMTGITPLAPHTFTDDCDENCDVCDIKRTAPHSYDHACDTDCNLCGATRKVNNHLYDDENDLECNRCGYVRPSFPVIGEMEDHTDKYYIDLREYRENYEKNGFFTVFGGSTVVTGGGLILKDSGQVAIKTTLTFNGNVDFSWLDNNKDGEYKYENGWGKYGVQIGTYFDEIQKSNQPLYVSFRRCTGAAYLFNAGNRVLGEFGSCGSTTAESVDMVILYDIDKKEVSLWIDGKYANTCSIEHLENFKFTAGFVQQGTGVSAVDPTDPTNSETIENSVTYSNYGFYGDFMKDPDFIIPVLEPMTDNLAKYIELLNGSNSAAYFERKFTGGHGTSYNFGGIKYDPTKAMYHVSFDYVITERSKDANGNDVSWGSIRLGVMEAGGFKYQLSTLPTSTNLLANGGGYAGYNAPAFAKGSKVGEKHNLTIQYDFVKNRFSVWFDGEMVLRAVELPATDNESRTIFPMIHFEACSADVSDLKIWGTGISVEISDEYKALLNDPLYTSTVIPAKPEGNINYWTFISARNQTGDLAFDMISDEFSNFWSDEQGRVIFRDSYGKRNLNGITNDATFVARFKYKVTEDDPDYVEAKKQRGSVFTVRGYNLPTSQGKKNNYEIGFMNNAITVTTYKDSAAVSTVSSVWNRELNKEYDIAIISAPNWVKIFVDGKLMTMVGGLYQYTFDFCYESVHTCAEIYDMQLYDVKPNDAKEPVKNNAPTSQLTGATVNTIEHTNVPLASGTLSIWLILTLAGAVLCLAGAAVFTVVFIKKKKSL